MTELPRSARKEYDFGLLKLPGPLLPLELAHAAQWRRVESSPSCPTLAPAEKVVHPIRSMDLRYTSVYVRHENSRSSYSNFEQVYPDQSVLE